MDKTPTGPYFGEDAVKARERDASPVQVGLSMIGEELDKLHKNIDTLTTKLVPALMAADDSDSVGVAPVPEGFGSSTVSTVLANHLSFIRDAQSRLYDLIHRIEI